MSTPVFTILSTTAAPTTRNINDVETLKLVRTATDDVRAEDFNDKEVWIKAAPPGYTATALEGKTFTASLVELLKENQPKGVPLHVLQEKLREK